MTHPQNRPEELPIEGRLIALETQLAHTMRLYEQLNEVVVEQATTIGDQSRAIKKLHNQLRELKNTSASGHDFDPAEERPPHY